MRHVAALGAWLIIFGLWACACADSEGESSTSTAPGGWSAGGSSTGTGGAGTGTGGSGATGGTGGSGAACNTAAAFAPVFFDDFETYTDGESLSGFHPFDAAGRTVATTEQAYSGTLAARMEIRAGDGGGWGQWGGVLPLDPVLPKGAEIWVRLRVYWPASFQFTASPWMKFLRLHNRTGTGENGGYNDLYVDNADGTTSVLRLIKEVHDVWEVYDGPSLPRDTWETYEMYLFIDDIPVDSGGEGRVRVWRDHQIIFDRTDVPTITEDQGVINSWYIFTYWNNETPPDNHCYVDDLVIATSASPPPNVDAGGHCFIGDWAP